MKESEERHKDSTLVEQTQERILEYISQNGYTYNTVLPKENELAEILGVSRVVVREAYSGLRALGFLETKRKKGTVFVAPKIFNILKLILMSGFIDKRSLQDIYELRLMLEIGMADLVVKNVTDEDIDKLKEIAESEDRATNSEELRQIDVQFHTTLYDISKNESLKYFQHLLTKVFKLYTPRPADWKAHSMMTHNTLVEMLRKRDVELFRTAMRIHLEYQFRNKTKNLCQMEEVVAHVHAPAHEDIASFE